MFDACQDTEEVAPNKRINCWVCGRFFFAPVFTVYDTKGKRCPGCVAANRHFPRKWGQMVSADSRDFTPEPPAYLDPLSVIRMRAMVKDAQANGYRPWPYTRDAA
jgi:hypothetical protein